MSISTAVITITLIIASVLGGIMAIRIGSEPPRDSIEINGKERNVRNALSENIEKDFNVNAMQVKILESEIFELEKIFNEILSRKREELDNLKKDKFIIDGTK